MIINDIRYNKLSQETFQAYSLFCKKTKQTPLFFTCEFSSELWGIVAYKNKTVVGGWIGKMRANKPIIKILAKSIWFDSFPVVESQSEKDKIALIKVAMIFAKQDSIVLFNVTHWSREQFEYKDIISVYNKNATFVIDLSQSKDVVWGNVAGNQKNIVRKGVKNEIILLKSQGKSSLEFLMDFQKLREQTQGRAIRNNKNASMLLKSDNFFRDLMSHENSYLFVAKYDNEVVSVALMLVSNDVMYYYSGGSDWEKNKKTGASALLVWHAIEEAQMMGLKSFDLGGVPVNPDKSHPAYGVYGFKKSFGGEYTEFDSGKIIISPLKFKVLNFFLKQRKILRILSKKA